MPDKSVEANSEAAKAELKLAFEMANETIVNAAYYMNAASLSKSFTGEALKTLSTRIETLIANDTYLQSVLEKRTYKNIQLSNNQPEGQVEVDETWSYIYFNNSTKLCIGRQPNMRSTETVYFKKNVNGWMETLFTTGNEPIPQMVTCN